MEDIMNIINNAAALLKEKGADKATIGLILGSGLGDYAETLENKRFVNYADIEGYPDYLQINVTRLFVPRQYLFPIPQNERVVSPMLTQNPGY